MFQFWLCHTEEAISVVKNASPFYLANCFNGEKNHTQILVLKK